MFFIRRIVSIVCVLLMQKFIWGQLAILAYLSLFMCFIIGWFEPLESRSAMKVELFNEATALVLIYLLICFTDFMADMETRSDIGLAYLSIGLGNILVHLVLMWIRSYHAIRLSCRRRRMRKQAQTL